ncbi:hypothetical protein ACFPN0_15245 [Kitasatospora cinereorecta]
MTDFIHVQPAAEQRVGFARWAVTQDPKVRTVSPSAFSVPHNLFTDVPEPLLIGALVDGHRYVSPDEDQTAELLGVANSDGLITGIPGVPLPEVPEEAYGPDSTPLPGPDLADEPSEAPESVFPCPGCDREFTTERGRDTHLRQKHPED